MKLDEWYDIIGELRFLIVEFTASSLKKLRRCRFHFSLRLPKAGKLKSVSLRMLVQKDFSNILRKLALYLCP
ncbi:MAG: hypothetical protein HXY48_11575 [Ignavibacteriaceae bacterium]|nr:hypothetical protein [Ignavibacteriaceae bacterium]